MTATDVDDIVSGWDVDATAEDSCDSVDTSTDDCLTATAVVDGIESFTVCDTASDKGAAALGNVLLVVAVVSAMFPTGVVACKYRRCGINMCLHCVIPLWFYLFEKDLFRTLLQV